MTLYTLQTEAMLQNQTEASQKIKRGLEEKLEEKEKEFRREMEKMKVQAAFKVGVLFSVSFYTTMALIIYLHLASRT